MTDSTPYLHVPPLIRITSVCQVEPIISFLYASLPSSNRRHHTDYRSTIMTFFSRHLRQDRHFESMGFVLTSKEFKFQSFQLRVSSARAHFSATLGNSRTDRRINCMRLSNLLRRKRDQSHILLTWIAYPSRSPAAARMPSPGLVVLACLLRHPERLRLV